MASFKAINVPQIAPWQQRAIQVGRTPLPDAPGDRPWLRPPTPTPSPSPPPTASETRSESSKGSRKARAKPEFPRQLWTNDEVERLVQLKLEGKSWTQIEGQFPTRSSHALRQCWWKHQPKESDEDQ